MDYRVVIKGSEPAGRVRKSEKRIKMWERYDISQWYKEMRSRGSSINTTAWKKKLDRTLNPDE